MSLARAWYVMCDWCGAPAPISTASANDARAVARVKDFSREHGKDLCPKCRKALPVNMDEL